MVMRITRNTARFLQSAKKAGLHIDEDDVTGPSTVVEQEEPDIN